MSRGPTNKELLEHIHRLLHHEQHGLEHLHRHQLEILERINRMSAESTAALARLTASVAKNTTVDQGILDLVTGLAQQIRDNSADPVALNALADQIDADQQKLSDAIAANTPADPNA